MFKISSMFAVALAIANTSVHATEGLVKVAMAKEEYPPFFFTEKGTRIGFEVDMAKEICSRIDLKCTVSKENFAKLIPSVRFQKNDIIVSALTDNEFRRRVINFSKAYSKEEVKVAVSSDNKESQDFCSNCPSVLDLSNPEQHDMFDQQLIKYFEGKKIAVLKGTVGAQYLTQNPRLADKFELVHPKNIDEELRLIRSGEVAASFDISQTLIKTDENKFAGIRLSNSTITGSFFGYGLAVGVTKNKPELLAKVNTALEQMRKDGTIEQLTKKWLN